MSTPSDQLLSSPAPPPCETGPHEPPAQLAGLYEEILHCVHCGFCLPACPTYRETGLETESPRGRIYLMRAAAEGRIALTKEVESHLDLCLGCRACETACPAGVKYGLLLEGARADLHEALPPKGLARRLGDLFLNKIFPSPRRLLALGNWLRLYQQSGLQWLVRTLGLTFLLPKAMRLGEKSLPIIPPSAERNLWSRVFTPQNGVKAVAGVALLPGCIASQLFAGVNAATIRVLTRRGAEVRVPDVGCCGSLQLHLGWDDTARRQARALIDACTDVEIVITNAAGCGSAMKDYGHVLAGDPAYAEKAAAFSAKVMDVSEAVPRLEALGGSPPLGPVPERVVYQDACHLAHGQRIRQQPRAMLVDIPGVTLVEMPHSDWCCGSAGVYNLTHPDMAQALLDEKMEAIASVHPDCIAVANPGCALQIALGAAQHHIAAPVVHPIELLDRADRTALQA